MAKTPTEVIDVTPIKPESDKKNFWIFPTILIVGLILAVLYMKWDSVSGFFKANPDAAIAGTPAVTPPPAPAKVAVRGGEITITQNCNTEAQQNHTLSKEQMQAAMTGGVTITQNCNSVKPPVVVAQHPRHRPHNNRPAPANAPPQTASAPTGASFWGWVHPYATSGHPKTCYADRQISGKPEQCTNVLVEPRKGGETENDWRVRMGEKQGISPGKKDAKGTISSVTTPDVNLSNLK